eukprot:3331919-Prymnesium_polylepis.1
MGPDQDPRDVKRVTEAYNHVFNLGRSCVHPLHRYNHIFNIRYAIDDPHRHRSTPPWTHIAQHCSASGAHNARVEHAHAVSHVGTRTVCTHDTAGTQYPAPQS